MKRSGLKAVLAMGALAASGCGSTHGFLRDSQSITQSQFRMEVSQIRYSRSASGSAKMGEALCLIPLNEAAYQHAMENLYGTARLGPNEVLTNFREDTSYLSYLGFYCVKQLTISADVMEVTPAGASAPGASVPVGK
jgi:hypothetical protein